MKTHTARHSRGERCVMFAGCGLSLSRWVCLAWHSVGFLKARDDILETGCYKIESNIQGQGE